MHAHGKRQVIDYCRTSSLENHRFTAETHRTGAFLVFTFAIGASLAATGAVILALSGARDHMCLGNTTVSYAEDPACVTQGYFYLIGTLIASGSSACQCCDLYLKVVHNLARQTLDQIFKFYMVFLFFFVLYPTLIVVSTNSIGYDVRPRSHFGMKDIVE